MTRVYCGIGDVTWTFLERDFDKDTVSFDENETLRDKWMFMWGLFTFSTATFAFYNFQETVLNFRTIHKKNHLNQKFPITLPLSYN